MNRRQAGAAIEGALRQKSGPLDLVAVDTHGHTHFAMSWAKFCGLDLCPRLARLPDRKLYLPRGIQVPRELRSVVSNSISTRSIQNGWGELLRISASVREGWCPATFIMDKYGSSARGNPVYEAGENLGKLLLTIYLCDYITNPDFRREIGRLLSQGESIHVLQRAINGKPLGPKTGRNPEELTAISDALTILTNMVIAWNTAKMQSALDRTPSRWPEAHLRHIAPIAHAHINMRGVMTFHVDKYRDRLLGRAHTKHGTSKV